MESGFHYLYGTEIFHGLDQRLNVLPGNFRLQQVSGRCQQTASGADCFNHVTHVLPNILGSTKGYRGMGDDGAPKERRFGLNCFALLDENQQNAYTNQEDTGCGKYAGTNTACFG